MTVPETKKFEIEIGGKTVTVETGKYAIPQMVLLR